MVGHLFLSPSKGVGYAILNPCVMGAGGGGEVKGGGEGFFIIFYTREY